MLNGQKMRGISLVGEEKVYGGKDLCQKLFVCLRVCMYVCLAVCAHSNQGDASHSH